MKGVSSDSSKILSEKLALSRELAALKPQVEHLQAQLVANQNLLAQKLSLQRELSAVQVELENEKRASSRARAQELESSKVPANLEAQMEALKAELAKERRDRQAAEREINAAAGEYEGKITLLESRLDAFRNKLKTTKEQLKDTQSQLQVRYSRISSATTLRESTDNTISNPQMLRKRSLAQMDLDATVGTPGDQQPNKRGKKCSALPGEKSEFSITPFLNKTGGISADSPEETPSRPALEDDATNDTTRTSLGKKGTAIQTKTADAPANALGAATANDKLKPKRSTLKLARSSNLDQVIEENDENDEKIDKPAPPDRPAVEQACIPREQPVLKKKRKLPGKTLFDGEDDEPTHLPGDGVFGSRAGLASIGKTTGAKAAVKLGPRVSTAARGSAFGTFSPLKLERKRSLLAG